MHPYTHHCLSQPDYHHETIPNCTPPGIQLLSGTTLFVYTSTCWELSRNPTSYSCASGLGYLLPPSLPFNHRHNLFLTLLSLTSHALLSLSTIPSTLSSVLLPLFTPLSLTSTPSSPRPMPLTPPCFVLMPLYLSEIDSKPHTASPRLTFLTLFDLMLPLPQSCLPMHHVNYHRDVCWSISLCWSVSIPH